MKQIGRRVTHHIFSQRTRSLLRFDLLRLWARLRHQQRGGIKPKYPKLHFGCGHRQLTGWLNVDIIGSEYDIDLACGRLPWANQVFEVILGQQVVEHLELRDELLPLLKELHRVSQRGAEIWLACPDMEKVCRSYFEHKGADLVEDRLTRFPAFSLNGVPKQHMVNACFHQGGEHKNLYDFELLAWALNQGGFTECQRVTEADFLSRFPEIPSRNDDYVSLYVRAIVS